MNIEEINDDKLSKPEKFLLDILNGLVVEKTDDPDVFLYKTDEQIMFVYNQKNKYLSYSQVFIGCVFGDNFGFNYLEINNLVRSMVEEYLNLDVLVIYLLGLNFQSEY